MLKVGDSVGGIYFRTENGVDEWYLVEDKINKIIKWKKGIRYYTGSKFRPLDAEDIAINTKLQEGAKGYILTGEVFGLNKITRPIAERWINMENNSFTNKVNGKNECDCELCKICKLEEELKEVTKLHDYMVDKGLI